MIVLKNYRSVAALSFGTYSLSEVLFFVYSLQFLQLRMTVEFWLAAKILVP